jgi:steroid delta-isomerase-like uncharacterized protein
MGAAEIARNYLESWNRKDLAGMRDYLDPNDYTYMGGDGQEQRGVDAGMAVAQTFANAFPDGRIDIQRVHEAANGTVIVEFIASGTQTGELMGIPATGKRIGLPVCNVLEIRDGKITREREYFDNMTMMTQLGVVQAPAAATA